MLNDFNRLVASRTRRVPRLAACMKASSAGRCRLRFQNKEAKVSRKVQKMQFPLVAIKDNDVNHITGNLYGPGEELALPLCDVDQPSRAGGQAENGFAW